MALEAFREIEPEWKDEREELITESDRSIESHLREKLAESFPADTVVGEEYADVPGDGEFTWYLDPIDGTAAYSMNLPIWGVSLGLYRRGEPVAGVLLAPFMDEEFYGSVRLGARKDGRPIDPVPPASSTWTSETLLCVTSDAHRAFSIDFPGKCRSLGSAAYQMALTADGRAVGALCGTLNIWDMAGVLGVCAGTPFRMRTLAGEVPNWERILAGKVSRESLVFAHETVMGELTERISER